MVTFMHQVYRDQLQDIAEDCGITAAQWLRARLAREWLAWAAGKPQPAPLGEYRGTTDMRYTFATRCTPLERAQAKELADARGMTVSHMVRDEITRETEALLQRPKARPSLPRPNVPPRAYRKKGSKERASP